MAWHHFTPPMGQRYIFFDSLKEPSYSGKRGKKFNPEKAFRYSGNSTIAELAEDYFSESNLNDENLSGTIEEFNAFMISCIQMLEELTANERTAEIAYLKNIQTKFKEFISNDNTPDIERKKISKLLEIFPKDDDKQWDYPTIISILTLTRNDSEKVLEDIKNLYAILKKQQEQQLDINIPRTIEVTKKKAKKKNDKEPVTKSLKEFFLTNYQQYIQAYLEAGGELITDTYAQNMADIIQQALKDLIKNPAVLNIIADNLSSLGFSTPAQQSEIIKNILVQQARDNSTLLKDLTNTSEIQQSANIYQQILLNLPEVSSVFNIKKDGKTLQAIEEFALTHYDDIANQFIEAWLSQPQSAPNQYNAMQLELLNNFDINGDDRVSKRARSRIQAIITSLKKNKNNRRAKSELTSILRKRLETKVSQTRSDLLEKLQATLDKDLVHDQAWQKEQQKILDEIFQTISINPTRLPDALITNLKITNIKAADAAEIISKIGTEVRKEIQQAVIQKTYIPGKAINLKTDTTFMVNFSPLNISNYLLGSARTMEGTFKNTIKNKTFKKAMTNLTTVIENFSQNFMTQYKTQLQAQDNSTDIQAAYTSYMENMKHLKDAYQEAIMALSDIQTNTGDLLTFLNSTFLGGVSVKQYEAFHQDLGFHGGSLGGDHSVAAGVEQVAKMYELGGITLPDTEFIINAILNCINGWVSDDFIEIIKDMLVGGALMMMFDDGFANTKKVLNEVQTMFGYNGAGPKTVHLYQFNTLFVPASYLLTDICEGLKLYQQDITKEFTDKKYTAASIEIYNDMSNKDIPIPKKNTKGDPYYSAKTRWNTVKNTAEKRVKIYILLMSGLLDLFEKLPDYMTGAIK